MIYTAAFALVYSGFIVFRLAYFGVPLPNTYYMKGGPTLQALLALLTLKIPMVKKAQNLLHSFLGDASDLMLLVIGLSTLVLIVMRRWTIQLWGVLIYLLCAFAIYMLLPGDWMPEYRFATVFFLLFYLYSALVIGLSLQCLPASAARLGQLGFTLLALVASFTLFSPRTEAFSRAPTVPFEHIRAWYADKSEWYKGELGLSSASLLLPDIGGVIYYSDLNDLNVYDLAGLTDQTVARTLGQHLDRAGFYNYVFQTVRPTFIYTHGAWTGLAKFEDDPRFSQLYVPICSYIDPWVERNYHQQRLSGDFVLRSVIETQPDQLSVLRVRLDNSCILQPPEPEDVKQPTLILNK
ncbi:MAG: hypothetical protein ABI700_19715 [Chloroflexota bacterium]